MSQSQQLVRKQFLVSTDNVAKLEQLASERGTSAADIVRLAIDAFDPNGLDSMAPEELIELVSSQLKDAIVSTKKANRKVSQTLKTLEQSTRG